MIEYPAGAPRLENGQFVSARANLTIVKEPADLESWDHTEGSRLMRRYRDPTPISNETSKMSFDDPTIDARYRRGSEELGVTLTGFARSYRTS